MTDFEFDLAVLGLGPMGRALAGAALDAGHPTIVWNRTPQKARPLLERGAVLAADAPDAARRAAVTVCCLLDYPAVQRTLDDAEAPAVLVNLGSAHPGEVRTAAAWAAAKGIGYLDGAILSPAPAIGTPTATILYSGPAAVFEAHSAVLRCFAPRSVYLGPEVAAAAGYEMALLDLFTTATGGLLHAFALALSAGLDLPLFARFAGGMSALLPEMAQRYARHLADDVYPGEPSTLAAATTAIAHVAAAAHDLGVDPGPLPALQAMFGRAVADGHGADGYARLARALARFRDSTPTGSP
ncbi:NAD(P)-dependent oxidoreductase [Dactylosporangium vinaceum]|uniref:NAD(P)-dependent oxidoreductase n=1 Tax=Dactylosporangium vinaceum TaxID=53362 RepID=A0ABV5M8X6_9ACTN|nr:NAD(P)-binding domain-containing protein [Dactylosporangium vinaceum]UAB99528.1 NAD(P)-dependent oxidoreductase [Dactylosporangium vinaceum]